MSSVIAVCVSLLGLSLALFTLAILIQMVLSFPAMLSSHSQAYIQQQRKLYHISSGQHATSSEGAEAEQLEMDGLDDEDEKDDVDNHKNNHNKNKNKNKNNSVVDRWIDVMDEATDDCSSDGDRGFVNGTIYEPITRGRTLRRQMREDTPRGVYRVADYRQFDHDGDSDMRYYEYDVNRMDARVLEEPVRTDGFVRESQSCTPRWRNIEWTK